MTAIVKCRYKVLDNMLVITPEEPISDNCQYEIRLKGFISADGQSSLDNYSHKVVTAMSPAYCKISDVAILVDTFDIKESVVLYYIREASKYADYIMEVSGGSSAASQDEDGVSFPVREFVKTKCMIDCLLKAYVAKAAGSGIKGTLGEISFENTEKYATSINDLLSDLYLRLKKWEDALRGYELEGRAAPVFATRAKDASSSDTDSFTDIVNDNTRTIPVGV